MMERHLNQMQALWEHSYLFGANASFIEDLYERYLADASSIQPEWRHYFDCWQPGGAPDVAHAAIRQLFIERAHQFTGTSAGGFDVAFAEKQRRVTQLMDAYRTLGARQADLNPLDRNQRVPVAELDLIYHGLFETDQKQLFETGGILPDAMAPLAEIVAQLKTFYCGTIGFEFMHLPNAVQRNWLQQRVETASHLTKFSRTQKQEILKQLTAAETLEKYLHSKYVGQKRFSLEGGESLIPALEALIQHAARAGIQEIVVGMAHRGRLNVLVNLLGKSPSDLFAEFEGRPATNFPSGDVKYHMGYSADRAVEGKALHLSLAYNPSHLEIVNPVVEGSVRARQQACGDQSGKQVLPLLIHGDAAFIGLGTNQGTFSLSQARGYTTGGTVHIVINNQIGFTTSDIRDTRSTFYCTDIAKMVDAPIFHVNGDDPEAVVWVTQLAFDYRQQFGKDSVVDIVCFRRWGHNEGDDPSVTQPLMYQQIAAHPGARKRYLEQLMSENGISASEAENDVQAYRAALDRGVLPEDKTVKNERAHAIDFSPYLNSRWAQPAPTAWALDALQQLAEKLTTVPAGFKLHPTVDKLLKARRGMAQGEQPIDWGMAETLAYGALLQSGYPVRLSGEDSGRGTFAHRHAVFHHYGPEQETAVDDAISAAQADGPAPAPHPTERVYVPLSHLSAEQAPFIVIDSILNEEAVLAFEYGYACAAPRSLVLWEAQFGDFANGAQVVIDQFISSGETKWGRLCGLTMLLPHGYDGQGPEHSSARLERFLQLCAEENIQVVMMSEASQLFHVLRRQALRPYRKPLVIFLSKRLLRFKESMSHLEAFTQGGFRTVISDPEVSSAEPIERVIVCSGQVYYDLAAARRDQKLRSLAILRLEQLYPFPHETLSAAFAQYPRATEIRWVQEEPLNQGAWMMIRDALQGCLSSGQTMSCIARPISAAPAVGYGSKHTAQLKTLIDQALK